MHNFYVYHPKNNEYRVISKSILFQQKHYTVKENTIMKEFTKKLIKFEKKNILY